MSDIMNIHNIVKDILKTDRQARNSDMKLYAEVCLRLNPDIKAYGLYYAFNNHSELGIPNYETVRRTRQKIQADNPDLKADDAVIDGRYEAWKEYREYATS